MDAIELLGWMTAAKVKADLELARLLERMEQLEEELTLIRKQAAYGWPN